MSSPLLQSFAGRLESGRPFRSAVFALLIDRAAFPLKVQTHCSSVLPLAKRRVRRSVLCIAVDMNKENKKYIADSIRAVPDFPKKGINFHDVTTLLLDPKVTARWTCQLQHTCWTL